MKQNVKNVPAYAMGRKWWVARCCDGALWFWGAWDDETAARNAASDVGGVVVSNC